MYSIEQIENSNPLLNQIIISNKNINFQSIIYPNLGASLQKYAFNDIDYIDGISNNQKGLDTYKDKFNSSFLFPFPSRITDGKYTFNNTNYQLDCNEAGQNNALHGHIHNKPFVLTSSEAAAPGASLTLSYTDDGTSNGFKFPYEIKITYVFFGERMGIQFKVINNGDSTFPFGIGWHPYFKTNKLNESSLNFASDTQISFNDKMQAIGTKPIRYKFPLIIEDKSLDDGFILINPYAEFKSDAYTLDLQFSSAKEHSFLQLYIPPNRESIAIEPMTCATDSFNNKMGLLELKPNETYLWAVNLKIIGS